MSIVISEGGLRRELARRGLNLQAFAEASGVSRPTLSAAMAGKPIRIMTVRRIAKGLARIEPLAGVDALLNMDKLD